MAILGPDCNEFVASLASLQKTSFESVDTTPYFPFLETAADNSYRPAHLEALGSAPMFATSTAVKTLLKDRIGPVFGFEEDGESTRTWAEVTEVVCKISTRMFGSFPSGNGFVAGGFSADNHAMLGYNVRFESIYGIAGVKAADSRTRPVHFRELPNVLHFGGRSFDSTEAAYRSSRFWVFAKNDLVNLPWRGLGTAHDGRRLIAIQWRLVRKSTADRSCYYSDRIDIFPFLEETMPVWIDVPEPGLAFVSGFDASTRNELVRVGRPTVWNVARTTKTPVNVEITTVDGRGLALNRYSYARDERGQICVMEDQVKFSLDPESRVLGVSLTRFELAEIITDFRRVPPSIAACRSGVN